MTISAKIIQDSIFNGKRITTYELDNVRFTHSEFMTHRVFSRNSASSRAIPIKTMNDLIRSNPAKPIHWGKNKPGMQASEELDFADRIAVEQEWLEAARDAIRHSDAMAEKGAHKQICNRVTESFQYIKVVMTTTEDTNWFWLRDHKDAQPEIKVLAQEMQIAKQNSIPMEIMHGEWHLPYIDRKRIDGELKYFTLGGDPIGLNDAKAVSASCCAQVSYRKLDDTLEKASKIFKQLIESEPCHASPCEHQATPISPSDRYIRNETGLGIPIAINLFDDPNTWEFGITHVDRNGKFWSGNFQGWIQYRQLIPGNVLM